jgi:hypothetical protein
MNAIVEELRRPLRQAEYEFCLLMIRLGVYKDCWLPFVEVTNTK